MVISHIKRFFANQSRRLKEISTDKGKTESFRETEEMRKAEEMKREADRLAQLKQYNAAIEEYSKALEYYPYKGSEKDIFKNASEFVFKCNYNIAACFSYLDSFEEAIDFFDRSLLIGQVDDENKVKALMGKGTTIYRKKMLVEGRYRVSNYLSDAELSRKAEEYKKEDEKKNFIRMSHECYRLAADLDRNNIDAWYSKGHMELLMNKIKDAVQSFDNVITLNKNYENKESLELFDEIKREKGITVKGSELVAREYNAEPTFKTKTGHMVRSRSEMMIANFLYENNLLFQYNTVATWADSDDFKPSFFIPRLDVYIDHFQYDNVKDYQKMMRSKIKQYEKHRKKHLFLTSEDEKNIEETIKLKMKPYIIL